MSDPDLEKRLFLAALDLKSPVERDAYLRNACGDDEALRERLRVLVAMHEQSAGPLDQPPISWGMEPTRAPPVAEEVTQQIGPYKLLQRLGEGGMGVVYMAEQSEPVKRRVALKLIKPGLDSRQVIARFEAERQALSLMDHPHIAKVLDAGSTDTNRPYFVMELVKGRPITQYCDERRLPTRERLELFLAVCQAIQHAHQKGIIHRDIKPTNVLVAEYDGRPVAKVIDFGVAKATSQTLTERTMFTEFGAVVGTLEYMSPEQASFNQLDIDTRSDVYSLGVLLYELLTGSTPLDRSRLRSAALDEVLRVIREEEPVPLSTKLGSSENLPSIAANRSSDPARLSALVRGELDWITQKSLEKDRNRRYESAHSLAQDIQRYLLDEPVSACPPSAPYRAAKFMRRHKTAIATATLVAVSLLAGLAGMAWQARVATLQRDRAIEAEGLSQERLRDTERQREVAEQAQRESLKNFTLAVTAVDRLYDQLERRIANEPQLTDWQRELLEGAREYYERFAETRTDDPQIEYRVARAHRRVGEILRLQGNWSAAVEAFKEGARRSADLAQRGRLSNPAELAEVQLQLAEALGKIAAPDDVEAAFAEALSSCEAFLAKTPDSPTSHVRSALALMARGNARHHWGRYAEAEQDLASAVDRLGVALQRFPGSIECQAALCKTRISRAANYVRLNQPQRQEEEERAARRLAQDLAQAEPSRVDFRDQAALVEANLGATLAARGELAESVELLKSAVRRYESLIRDFPERDPLRANAALAFANYALALGRLGADRDEARSYQRLALAERERLARRVPDNLSYQREYANSLLDAGNDLVSAGKYAEASGALNAAVEILRDAAHRFPDDYATRELLASHLGNLGVTLRRQKDYSASAAHFVEALEQSRWLQERAPTLPRELSRAAMLKDGLASTLEKLQRFAEALEYRREAVQALRDLQPDVARKAFPPAMRALLLANLAFSLHLAEAYRESLEAAREALAANPMNTLARGLVAEILANCPDPSLRDPRQALKIAAPLLTNPSSAPYGAGIHGIANFRLEEWTVAKHYLETAVRGADGVDPAWDTLVQFYFAATLHRLGELDAAKSRFQTASERAGQLPQTRRDLEEARSLAKSSLDEASDTPDRLE